MRRMLFAFLVVSVVSPAAAQLAESGRHSVMQWPGADPTGVGDSTAPLQAGIDALCATGGGELEIAGTFRVTATLHVRCSNLSLVGLGHGQLHGDLTWDARSRLVWTGPIGGTLLEIAPTADPLHGRAIIGSGVRDILLDCNSIAATCLYVGSTRYGRFRVGYSNPSAGTSLTAGVVFDTVDISEYNDTQSNDIDISGAELGSGGKGVLFQGKSRHARNQGAPYFGNTSYNVIHRLDLHYWRGTAITLRETDNNVFEIWGANAPPRIPAGFATPAYATATSIELEGCAKGDPICFNPSNNVFIQGGVAGPVMARGTEAGAFGASGINAGIPSPNLFLRLDKGNGVSDPTIGTGAYAYFGDNDWNEQGLGIYNGVFSDSRAGSVATREATANAGGAMFHAGVGPAIRLQSADHKQQWNLSVNADGSFALAPQTPGEAWLRLGQAAGDNTGIIAGQGVFRGAVRSAGHIVVTQVEAPKSASSPCALGQQAVDLQYRYDCVAPDTWRRAPHSPW